MSVNITLRSAVRGMNSSANTGAITTLSNTLLGRRVLGNSNFVEDNYSTIEECVMDMLRSDDDSVMDAASIWFGKSDFRGVGRSMTAIARRAGIPRVQRGGSYAYPDVWLVRQLVELAAREQNV